MIYIDRNSSQPLYEQIYSHFSEEILTGTLAAGSRLPATRKLAEELSIGRNTVDRAYQQLTAEGYVQPRTGSGFIVNRIPIEKIPQCSKKILPAAVDDMSPSVRYDFAYGAMDNSVFPYNHWRKSLNNALGMLEMSDSIHYPQRTGELALRQEIVRYLYHSRGVSCKPEQVVITCGQQHSMEIIANMFEDTGKTFSMEDPGYDGIRTIFSNHNFHMNYIPVEKDGISIECATEFNTDLLYITPSHQFPTGAVMSIGKRKELLHWAEKSNTYLIEDDYYSELRYYTNPIPSLQSLDKNSRTIYTGTFSKSLSPFMRLAYIIFPQSLLPRYYKYYSRYNSQVSTLHQLALADFMASGCYERHLNRLRTFYKKKHTALLTAISTVFGNSIEISGEGAGLHLLLNVKGTLSQDELIDKAGSIGIKVYSTKDLYAVSSRCPVSQLLIGFPTIPHEAFEKIMYELKNVWDMS